MLLRGWAEARGLRMEIVLNAVRADGEYEELVLLYPQRSRQPCLTLWRAADMVALERGPGLVERFGFLSAALDRARLPDTRAV